MLMSSDWLVPKWPAPQHVRSICTGRSGGKSAAPYNTLNLGSHVGDNALTVGTNRALLHRAIDAKPVFLSQTHGTRVVTLNQKTAQGTEADACFTREHGVACTIMIADCLPVLLTDEEGSFVAAAHAGWRGLAGTRGVGVLESLFQVIEGGNYISPSRLLAWLGPCIGPKAFEVGPEVKRAFVQHDPDASYCFTPAVDGKWMADLAGLARLRLRALGIRQIFGNDGDISWCTVSNPSRFFSHRRDRGVTGRMAACIWLE
jgi:YfiH family protein